MARLARIIIPGLPHHVTQRGNRREQVFFCDADYEAYIGYLSEAIKRAGSEIWAWCLMPNHVHLIVVPSHEDGLRQSFAGPNRKYASRINARNKWTGHLWQGRYGSVVMDEAHLYHAFAYIALNPVRAGLVKRAQDWKWSSIHAHMAGCDDTITTVAPAISRIGNISNILEGDNDLSRFEALRKAEITGRPIGNNDFIEGLEKQTNRTLKPKKRGPTKKL